MYVGLSVISLYTILMKNLKSMSLILQPYGERLTVICCSDVKKVINKIKKEISKDVGDSWVRTVERTYEGKDGACFVSILDDNDHYICFQNKLKSLYEISILAHEALHVTNKILSKRGLYLTDETEEAYTYFQQYIIKEAGHFLMNVK